MVSIFNINIVTPHLAAWRLMRGSSLPEQQAMTAEEAAEISASLLPLWIILCAGAVLVFLVTIYSIWKDAKS